MTEDVFYGSDSAAPPIKSSTDKKQIEDAASRDRRDRDNARKDMVEALANEACARVLTKVLEYTRLYHANTSNDAAEMARSEGRRMVGLWLLSQMLTADPLAYIRIQQSRYEAQQKRMAADVAQAEAAKAKGGLVAGVRRIFRG